MKQLRLAIDLDGILTEDGMQSLDWRKETPYSFIEVYRQAKPNQDNIDFVNAQSDHRVTVYTARDEFFREVTMEWLAEHDVNYDFLVMNKLYFDLLLDDRATNDVLKLKDMMRKLGGIDG